MTNIIWEIHLYLVLILVVVLLLVLGLVVYEEAQRRKRRRTFLGSPSYHAMSSALNKRRPANKKGRNCNGRM